jgi:predicted RNA binding protein YcfA (HicA-like mRNA interferase family)
MRQSKGSHEIWTNPRMNLSAVLPRHSGDMPKGTLSAVLRQLGIDRDEFDAA